MTTANAMNRHYLCNFQNHILSFKIDVCFELRGWFIIWCSCRMVGWTGCGRSIHSLSNVCLRFVQCLSKVCPCPMCVQALPTHFGKIQYLSNLCPGQIHSLSRDCLYQATLSKQFYTGHTLDTRFSKVCPDIVHSKPLLASPTSNVRTSSKFCPHPMFVQTKI